VSTKKKTTQNSTTVTTPTNPEWVTSGIQGQMGRINDLASADPFSFVAGPSALQRQAFDTVGGLGAYVPGLFSQAAAAGQGAASYQPSTVSAQSVAPTQAFSGFGAADPTSALARSLSGSVDNPYLAAMNQANINQAMQGYNDALGAATQTLTRQALPALRSGAMLAGQYGGSRQGIAEGLALSDVGVQAAQNARNLAQSALDSGSNLYGGAYESAQNRAAQTATSLAGMALENARANADRSLQADTTNAANGLGAAQLNLQGGQALGALGQQGLDALGQFGATQQQLDALYRRAPLDLLQATTGMYGQLPLNLFNGSNQTMNGVTTEKTSGLGNAIGAFGNLAQSLGFNPFSAWGLNPMGSFIKK
jgi:hypothetical protein